MPWERTPSHLPGRHTIGAMAMRFVVCLFAVLFTAFSSLQPSTVEAQSPPSVVEEVSSNKFRAALLKAAQEAAKKGELRRVDVIRLRVATLSPAFVEQAQELAVIQMAFSGEEVPTDENGKIEVSRIDWEGLASFLERLIPLILKLLDLLAMAGTSVAVVV